MDEEPNALKVGQICFHDGYGRFVKVTEVMGDGLVAYVYPNENEEWIASHSRLFPVPDWVFEGRESSMVIASAEPIKPFGLGALADFANSLNQGIRITIESRYEEAAPCDEPC